MRLHGPRGHRRKAGNYCETPRPRGESRYDHDLAFRTGASRFRTARAGFAGDNFNPAGARAGFDPALGTGATGFGFAMGLCEPLGERP